MGRYRNRKITEAQSSHEKSTGCVFFPSSPSSFPVSFRNSTGREEGEEEKEETHDFFFPNISTALWLTLGNQ